MTVKQLAILVHNMKCILIRNYKFYITMPPYGKHNIHCTDVSFK